MAEGLRSFYDLIVVGAGPAGSRAAQEAARRGVKVLLIDRKERIGFPVQCAELVSQWVFRHASFSPNAIVQSIEAMILHLPDQAPLKMKHPGYMLSRSLFDQELTIAAVEAGTELSIGTRALHVSSEGILLQQGAKERWIQAKVIIGADGVHSVVARSVHRSASREVRALQYEIVLFEPQSHIDIYFHPDFEGGYAWLFPKGKSANVGIGVTASKTALLQELLDRFLRELKNTGRLPRIEIVSKTGGSIPCEPREKIVFGNILLVGDAAGHAHPITGAGILNALIGGQLAGKIAAEAILRGDLQHLNHYEAECREAFGRSLRYAFFKRNFLEEHWNRPDRDWNTLIRQTWVGFKDYYQERRKEKR